MLFDGYAEKLLGILQKYLTKKNGALIIMRHGDNSTLLNKMMHIDE